MQRERLSNYKDMKPSNAIAWILLAMFGYWMVTSKGGFFQMLGSLFGLGSGGGASTSGLSSVLAQHNTSNPIQNDNAINQVESEMTGVDLPRGAAAYKEKANELFDLLNANFPNDLKIQYALSGYSNLEKKQVYIEYGQRKLNYWNGSFYGTLIGAYKDRLGGLILTDILNQWSGTGLI